MPFNVFLPLACLLLAACAQQPAAPPPVPAADTANTGAPHYSETELGDVLVAEVAAQNGNFGLALDNYTQQASATRDPAIAEQAARLALYMGRAQTALDMAALWLARQPQAADAIEIRALAHVLLGQTDAVKTDINQLLTLAPDTLPQLLAHSQELSPSQLQVLLDAMAGLADTHPDQAPLWFARAIVAQQAEHYQEAIVACDRSLTINPDHVESWLLKSRLLVQAGKPAQADKVLARAEKRFADQPMVAINRIQLQLQQQDVRAARKAAIRFMNHFPDEDDMQLALARHALKQQAPAVALPLLEHLRSQEFQPDTTAFLLAQALAAQQQWQGAIDAYLQVKGDQALQAGAEAARLVYQQQRGTEAAALFADLRQRHPGQAAALFAVEASLLVNLDRTGEADALLAQGLAAYPKDTDLLYLTAMREDKRGEYAAMEKHLHAILDIDPNNTNALNALGYTLANHSTRYQEAWYYIKRAYAREPNNSAIQDSLGWVLFRLGRLDEALPLLQSAWAAQPDPEVAAHLVEVLRAKGDADAANQLLQDARQRFPASPLLASPAATDKLP